MYEVNDEFYLRIPLNPINILNIDNNIFDYCKENFMENIVINSKSLYVFSNVKQYLIISSLSISCPHNKLLNFLLYLSISFVL